MRVLLTFDIEIWCTEWTNLDAQFPQMFERYVYGASSAGQYGLPKILELLRRYGLRGVFFVEPLFAGRFGLEHLRTIVSLLQAAGQDIQLHLHPEWADEITPPPLPTIKSKRQHLRYYSRDEQTALIELGIDLLLRAGARRPTAFRAGSFAANRDTFYALAANGLRYDSSIDAAVADSVPDLRGRIDLYRVSEIESVIVCPMSVFKDGGGRLRHAQVGACSSAELVNAMKVARRLGWRQFTILSHNFEMLKPGSTAPDWFVVRRFEQLCDFLGRSADEYTTAGFETLTVDDSDDPPPLPQVGRIATLRRYAEQALRRFL